MDPSTEVTNWMVVAIMSIFVVAPTIAMAVAVLVSRRSTEAIEASDEKGQGDAAESHSGEGPGYRA